MRSKIDHVADVHNVAASFEDRWLRKSPTHPDKFGALIGATYHRRHTVRVDRGYNRDVARAVLHRFNQREDRGLSLGQ